MTSLASAASRLLLLLCTPLLVQRSWARHVISHKQLLMSKNEEDRERFLQTEYIDPNCVEPDLLTVPENTPSPETDDDIVKLTDEDADFVSYVELPPDTIYVESVAINTEFSETNAYVIAQRYLNPGVTFEIESTVFIVRPGLQNAEPVFTGPLLDSQNGTDISAWGTALSDDGILYVGAYNRNSIMAFDLKSDSSVALWEIENVPAPNDIALNPEQTVIYAAGGTIEPITNPINASFSNPNKGQVWKVDLETQQVTSIQDDLRTLAGIEVLSDGTLWVSQLYNMFTMQDDDTDDANVVWQGLDSDKRWWLADNIDLFDGTHILTPAWGVPQDSLTVQGLIQRICVATAYSIFFRLASAQAQNDDLVEAFLNPELNIAVSNTYLDPNVTKKEPVRIILMEPDASQAYHFEIDLVNTWAKHPPRQVFDPLTQTMKTRDFFNEQVTHIGHLSDHLVLINFEQPRVMLMKDEVFRDTIAARTPTVAPTEFPVTEPTEEPGSRGVSLAAGTSLLTMFTTMWLFSSSLW